jgi:8-oxo-dGTP pyrophosphatase MutT (NUDIX family)
MYLKEETIRQIEALYGHPREELLEVDMARAEMNFLQRSRRHERSHDVTVYILRDDQVAVIRKPSYPAELFRTPSGGIEPGEDFAAGAVREAREETGLLIQLERYVLRIKARFRHELEQIDWTSHVFTASAPDGELHPLDTHEIAEARWIPFSELKGVMRQRLLTAPSSGLRYRGQLDRLAVEEIERLAARRPARAKDSFLITPQQET